MSKLAVGRGWRTDECIDCRHQVWVNGKNGYRCTEFTDPLEAPEDQFAWCASFVTRAGRHDGT